jgi:hypothetical protein
MKHIFLFLFFVHFFSFASLAQKEKQRGLMVFGEIRKDYYEYDYEQGGIQKADTLVSRDLNNIYLDKYLYLPYLHYVSMKGKRLTNYAISGDWRKSIFKQSVNGADFTTQKYISLSIKASYAESYNYLNFFKGKMKAYIGGITQLETTKSSENLYAKFSLLAYTNLVYLHKKHYWIELGFPKGIASYSYWRKPPSVEKPFQNELKKPFLPIKLGIGFVF